MRWSMDLEVDAINFSFGSGPSARQQELEDGTVLDFDASGSLIGVEVLAVSHGWDPAALVSSGAIAAQDLETLQYVMKAFVELCPTRSPQAQVTAGATSAWR